MFFKKSHSANEIETAVNQALPSPKEDGGLDAALGLLAQAAEYFESVSMDEEAEITTQLLETIANGEFAMVKEAKKKAKKKTKTKTKSKKTKKTAPKKSPQQEVIEIISPTETTAPSSEDMVHNLEEIGWVFKKPSDCGECSMADDGGPAEVEVSDVGDNKIDLEKCPECGFDHLLEPEASFDAHFPGHTEKVNPKKEDEFLLNSIDV